MKYSAIALGAFIVAAVSAQPHGRNPHAHRHADKHAKRELVIVTDYVDITETVLLTATVWVDGKGNTIAPPVTGKAVSTAQGNPVTSSHSPAVFFEPAPTPTAAPPPPPAPKVEEPKPSPPPPPPAPVVEEPKPSPTPPPPAPVVEEPKPSPAPPPPPPAPKVEEPKPSPAPPPPPPAPKVEEPKPSPPPAPIVEEPKPIVVEEPNPAPVVEEPKPVVQAPSPPVEQAATPQDAPATGSISGPCAPGSPCTGDITFYQAGLGACGETHDGLSESVVALPHGMMGTQSNGNPFCGRMVSITKNGKTTSAKVVDKCMGCKDGDLDLSENAFAALGIDQSVGRTTAEWHFTS